MDEQSVKERETYEVAKRWFNALAQGDVETALNCLANDVEWFNYTIIPGFNDIMPWIGTYHGVEQVVETFKIFTGLVEVKFEELVKLAVQGEEAAGVIHERSLVKATGLEFEIEFVQWLTIRNGKIVRWKSYTDPSSIVRALRGDLRKRLVEAVENDDLEITRYLLRHGADPNSRNPESGLTVLMIAAGKANAEIVKTLLDAGADVFAVDSIAGASALHKACQAGSIEVARLLVEAGAFIDWAVPATGHTPLIEALWFKSPDIVEYLLQKGAGLNINTHYGFTLLEHFQYALNVNVIGKEKLLQADKMLKERHKSDEEKIQSQKLMAVVTSNDIATVKQLIQSGVDVDERYPILNGFNDYHTPLLVAARDGHTEIVVELLKAGADVNATEPTFGAVPLHKAVYNGHADITTILVEQPGIDINFQGATNGYTPLHDAIWHGFADCTQILIEAGARLDLKGHDGKTPLNIAIEVFGLKHEVVQLIQSKLSKLEFAKAA
ncbi:MAG: ankyrin repeat domain-containing protein [Tolypothrix carrinoi HA7290-LM1]|jgi:ankyrin repeat protein|nr:ankyrin repeat domain-containing protein [Tolypothrix carrinoi HA7290-LM1]